MGQAGWMARWSRFESKYQLGLINYLELVYKHPRNVSKRFQKDISSKTKDIKQFSQLFTHANTDTVTHGLE